MPVPFQLDKSKKEEEKSLKTLIIGAGEVGTALREVLNLYHTTMIRDISPSLETAPDHGFKVLQICYPDSPRFIEITRDYIKEYVVQDVTIKLYPGWSTIFKMLEF